MTPDIIKTYLAEVQDVHRTGEATEHSYRPALTRLFGQITPGIKAVNEPKGVEVGRPDFVFQRGKDEITAGHCEAKNIGIAIARKAMDTANRAQFDRYVKGFSSLLYTNCLDFHVYRQGELVRKAKIATLTKTREGQMILQPDEGCFPALCTLLQDFCAERLQTITSAEKLAGMMAGKAAIIRDVLSRSLARDKDLQTELGGQYQAFKDQLVHDLKPEDFADIYAETIAYGLFAARLHDDSQHDFSRTEALDLLPKSNPFLKNLFSFVAGPNLDEALRRTIDELAEIFQATNLPMLFEDFGAFTRRNDPFIHFYETFLAKYNPAKRKARGVWYTPQPVVKFIVRAVDEVLKSEFGLADGLADTGKITIDCNTGQADSKGNAITVKKDVHRVQILDPAAGTGTFLAEIIRQIAPKINSVAPGLWPHYVETELIPRLHGFELLMASYAMCHIKLEMMLKEMGYRPTKQAPRLNVFLTSALEEGATISHDLPFARWLADEAKGANAVKRNMPIMCVLGNPPYSGHSSNKGDWISDLMKVYKKEPGGNSKLQERNPKWINDDYVKFIRFAEHMITKNGEGILGFITNHGYLDNPTFRGMRWHLLDSFEKIFVLDLHGNAKKKEVAPDGKPDKNVFDIQQGVAIIIAVKKRDGHGGLAKVFHGDLWGDRQGKHDTLETEKLAKACPTHLPAHGPQYPFVCRDFSLEKQYETGFGVHELMPVNSVGIVTARDALTIDMDRDALWQRIEDFSRLDAEDLRQKYALGKDVRDWRVGWAKSDVIKHFGQHHLTRITYRPFDSRWTYYTGNSRGFHCYPRDEVMRHFIQIDNIGLCISKQQKASHGFFHVIAQNKISESCLSSNKTAEIGTSFLLYYLDSVDASIRVNMDKDIRARIERCVTGQALPPMPEIVAKTDFTPGADADGRPNEVAIFDYVYGVLHCPTYRQTYREFLKIDFPRIPCPPSPQAFWEISGKGTQLRRLHLMEDDAIGDTPFAFKGTGDSIVDRVKYKRDFVYINDTQYFEDVPQTAFDFYIGGYQPAQKWLKDRKGQALSFDDVRHYQKIIKILVETDRIMQTTTMDL